MKEIKKSVSKVDGMQLVMGKPVYTDDLPVHNPLFVKILRSPHAFAKIKSIDTTRALKLAGVECVLTYKDVPRNIFTRAGQSYPEPSPYDKFILDEYVRYVGDEVAIVAAENLDIANKALSMIKVDYEILPPVLDLEQAQNHPSIIHPEKEAHSKLEIGYNPSANVASTYQLALGDMEQVLSECPYVVKETYYTQGQAHVMMETPRATSYLDHQGRIVITSSTQVPFHVRRIVAHGLGIPASKVRVIKPRIGGGFGGKQAVHGEIIVAAVTLKTGKPAKLVYSRQETFESTYRRHPMKLQITLGANAEGIIKALDIQGISDTGAYGEHAPTVFSAGGMKTLPMYNKVDALSFQGQVVYTNKVPSGALRGYGVTQMNFALESAVNQLATKMQMDPTELRQKNMIGSGQLSPLFNITTKDGNNAEKAIDSCQLDYCLARGMELIDWKHKFPSKKVAANKVRGVGVAVSMQGSGISFVDMGAATLKLNEDGFFNLLVGATDIGTGSDTILAQIAGEALGVPAETIVVSSSDTDTTPFDTGAYASSTTYVSGNAVKEAAEKMKLLIEEEGAYKLGVPKDQVVFNGVHISTKDQTSSISLHDLSNMLLYSENQKQLVTAGSFVGHKSPPPFVAGFAEVEVDLETGQVDLIEMVAVVDGGTIINPKLAKVQIEGGLAQGIGMALFEDVQHNSRGKLINNTLMKYKIPTREDIKKITVEFADSYEPTGPYGAKSIGEVCVNTAPPAIASAVYHATGVHIRTLPITAEKVLLPLKAKKDE